MGWDGIACSSTRDSQRHDTVVVTRDDVDCARRLRGGHETSIDEPKRTKPNLLDLELERVAAAPTHFSASKTRLFQDGTAHRPDLPFPSNGVVAVALEIIGLTPLLFPFFEHPQGVRGQKKHLKR